MQHYFESSQFIMAAAGHPKDAAWEITLIPDITPKQMAALLQISHGFTAKNPSCFKVPVTALHGEPFTREGCSSAQLLGCIPDGEQWDWLRANVKQAAALGDVDKVDDDELKALFDMWLNILFETYRHSDRCEEVEKAARTKYEEADECDDDEWEHRHDEITRLFDKHRAATKACQDACKSTDHAQGNLDRVEKEMRKRKIPVPDTIHDDDDDDEPAAKKRRGPQPSDTL